jgi:hypothetical protein
MANGNAAIWRATGAGTNVEPTGANTDKVEFDIDNAVPDSTGHLNNTDFEISTGIADNEKAFQDVNEKQFTRVETVTLTISGHIQAPITSGAAVTLKVWELEDQADDFYTRGRFGLRINDFPIFNIKPKNLATGFARGGAIQNVKFIRSADFKNRVDFTLTFIISGDLKTSTGPNYDWST